MDNTDVGHSPGNFAARSCGTPVAQLPPVFRARAGWVRLLRLYDLDDDVADPTALLPEETTLDLGTLARSRFRSLVDPVRFARYSVHNADGLGGLAFGLDEHRLRAVREFRRVPLDASSLALTIFTARPGRTAAVVAALADFVERAVDIHQPGYLLLAHSLENPRLSLLLTAVHDALALGAGASSAFNLGALLTELDPLLVGPPECFAYHPDAELAGLIGAVSPYAV
jgi:hypothetical protein